MKILLILCCCFGFLFAVVDINTANQHELTTLKGIGSKKAEMIIAFRDKNGCFKSINDLTKVKGIGKKLIEKNKKELTITKCKELTK